MFDHAYARQFPNLVHPQQPQPIAEPQLVLFNHALQQQLGLPDWIVANAATYFAGATPLTQLQPVAQKYAGHQFGHYNPYLGDGRGLLLTEWLLPNPPEPATLWHGARLDIHLKGAGPTPYSRGGDGRAVLRSCIREFLGSEALYHLRIPTTRALALVTGATPVQRERVEPAAMLTRVAQTHIRFGQFEHCYHRGLAAELQQLIKFCVAEYFPACKRAREPNVAWFAEVVRRTAAMVAGWQAYGFAHGVMNTDNMSIVGETFDFGPFQFMDSYQPGLRSNHSDHSARYAFFQQPSVALWNLNCLAMAVSPVIASERLTQCLQGFSAQLEHSYWSRMSMRVGIDFEALAAAQRGAIEAWLSRWLELLAEHGWDYSLSWYWLAHELLPRYRQTGQQPPLTTLQLQTFPHPLSAEARAKLQAWWQQIPTALAPDLELAANTNPRYILRNYLAQTAIAAAEQGDLAPLQLLYKALQQPYVKRDEFEHLAQLPPAWAQSLQVSCSS